MKRKSILSLFLASTLFAQAQSLVTSSGSDLYIKSGTEFSVDGMTLTPSADFTIAGGSSITRTTTLNNFTANPYISRVYRFSSTSNPFSGTIRINYADGELNSITESSLRVNLHTGSAWQEFATASSDAAANFITSVSMSNTTLNEVTLAGSAKPLPVQWLSFTAKKGLNGVVLDWSTATESGTRSFEPQHSIDGQSWTSLSTLQAAGNSSTAKSYHYLHTTPAKGWNLYRILQRDLDGKSGYSETRKVYFDGSLSLTVLNNPVVNGSLDVLVSKATSLALYTSEGKLLYQQRVQPGVHHIATSQYAKGTYLLQADGSSHKVVLQ